MRHAITLPELGTGTGDELLRVSGWLVDVGDVIIAGDRVVEVLLPGITFDVEATRTGQLVEIVKPFDSVVSSGDVLGWIEGSDDETTLAEDQ